MKNFKLILASTLLLATLASCASEESNSTPPASTDTESSDSVAPETGNSPELEPENEFVMPEHYSHLDEEIAEVFVSIQYMDGFIYVPNMPLDEEMLEQMYGISPDLYSAYYGEVPMMSQQADMLLLFRSENTAELETALNNLLEEQRANLSQYPATLDKLEVAVVGTFGDYVYLNMLSSYPQNEADYDDSAMKDFYVESIEAVSAEIERVLGGGEPNAPFILEGHVPEDDFDESAHLGEFQTPSGTPSDAEMDESFLQPATPPEGDMDGMVEMPAIGAETGGHPPEADDPAVETAGGQSRN